ncbi:HK97 gp10 family phage protein [Heliobacterium chlorum]|uniref:HK97 gp10 family phage protein n=1 Tax=Heliobacterium chlorum TaxID=2698 RepID=A0ABR7T565_HELCL|nr:HK97 gp10 family phage protein [Heliobacterium chlorum]MBC9785505.1 HK97 gp10 family phage protein [Heliobacterium chlorum]
MKIQVKVNDQLLKRVEKDIRNRLKQAVHDCADDLVRASSETAPHDKGILEKSFAKEVTANSRTVTATVDYSVKEGGFNYALAMHELNYRLGLGSLAKPGGYGMSGKHYPVGNKFLTRPLEGETQTYKQHIERELQKILKGA